MSGVNDSCSLRHLVQFIDEDRAFFRQIVDNIAVMNDLLANIDGSAEGIERNLHDIDGANDAGTKAARLKEKDPLGFRIVDALGLRDAVKGGCGHVFKYTAFNTWQAGAFEPILVQHGASVYYKKSKDYRNLSIRSASPFRNSKRQSFCASQAG